MRAKNVLVILVVVSIAIASMQINAQNVAVTDDDGYTADPTAILDVKTSDKGVLVPRLTTVQRTSIASPATGLLVFDSNENAFFFYNGTEWKNLSNDQDQDPNNEIQSLSLVNDTLFLSSSNNVLLPKSSGSGSGSSGLTGCNECITQVSALSPTTMDWITSVDYCLDLTEGGFDDWRMPTIWEVYHYRVEMGLSVSWSASMVWSSTKKTDVPGYYFIFTESNGAGGNVANTTLQYCRCVR